jgi:hypothetical protein
MSETIHYHVVREDKPQGVMDRSGRVEKRSRIGPGDSEEDAKTGKSSPTLAVSDSLSAPNFSVQRCNEHIGNENISREIA